MDIKRVKYNLNRTVIHNGAPYLFTGCILRMNKDEFYYEAELRDTKARRSLLYCPLKDIKEE